MSTLRAILILYMKAYGIRKYGGNDRIEELDAAEPTLNRGEVRIEIHAASVNPVDLKIRSGQLKMVLPYQLPLILGNDGAGVITHVAADVSSFKPGDEVFFRPPSERIGTFAERISVRTDFVAHKPKNLSFEEAASLPLVGLTCWQAFFEMANLQRGQKVFIPAGSGGVGTFAIQLAKSVGAHVATTTSSRNVSLVKILGADEVIDYTSEDFSSKLHDFDLVLDTLGGKDQVKASGILKRGGRLISIAGPPTLRFASESGLGPLFKTIISILQLGAKVRALKTGTTYDFFLMHPDGDQLTQIAKLVESGKIRPVIDRIFPFEDIKEALDYCERGRARGKVIVQVKR